MSAAKPPTTAALLVEALVHGTKRERSSAMERAAKLDERGELLALVREQLEGEFVCGGQQDTIEHGRGEIVRTWLLGVIAQELCRERTREDEDLASIEALEQEFFDKYLYREDEKPWVRYWCLANLVRLEHPRQVEAAEHFAGAAETESNCLVRMLACAIRAARGSQDDVDELLAALEARPGTSRTRYALRALRIVSVPQTVAALERILRLTPTAKRVVEDDALFRDEPMDRSNYDAAVALSNTPAKFERHYAQAGGALLDALESNRDSGFRSGIVSRAISSLGKMKFVDAVGQLLLELGFPQTADSLEASAIALERILGTEVAINRIIDFALERDRTWRLPEAELYANLTHALRVMHEDAVVTALRNALASHAEAKRHLAERLLIELGGNKALGVLQAREDVSRSYTRQMSATEKKVNELVAQNLASARPGVTLQYLMDALGFLVSVGLLFWAAWEGYTSPDNTMLAAVGTALGGGGALYTLLIGSRSRARRTLEDTVKMQVVFLGYIRRLYQIDQAFARHIIEDEDAITPAELDHFGDAIESTMQRALASLAKLSE
jgi:hypothetical protein